MPPVVLVNRANRSQSYRKHLDEMLAQTFPELTQYLAAPDPGEASQTDMTFPPSEDIEQKPLNGTHSG